MRSSFRYRAWASHMGADGGTFSDTGPRPRHVYSQYGFMDCQFRADIYIPFPGTRNYDHRCFLHVQLCMRADIFSSLAYGA